MLHDAVLHHLMLGTFSQEQYIAEWVYNYGEWRRDLGEELWRECARCASDPRYFQFPFLRRILERSRAVIVHNPGAAAIAAAHGAENITVIPHFCERDSSAENLGGFRGRIGVPEGTTLFGIFGYLRETKRIVPCIQAFRRLHALRPETALLLAGECVSSDLERLLENRNRSSRHPPAWPFERARFRHRRRGGRLLSEPALSGRGRNLGYRDPSDGFGKTRRVTDNAENSSFPDYAVLRVVAGVAESAELFDHILLVTEFPQIAREIGREAQLHIREHHALEPVARRYWETLCAAAS